ncbi:DUF397 domain-containing protein [Nonomuraea sp. NPDC049028]|uniref:DUF397 domain-containing protein n=1 Tax=Nonomuraea sp. NPDC049028 TaxID=3364348 RepID=UPI003710604D
MTDEQGWITSSRTGSGQQCVQMRPNGAGVALRDSKNPSGPQLRAGADAWYSFLNGAKNGYFELPAPPLAATGGTAKPTPEDLNLISANWLHAPDQSDARLLIAFAGSHVAMRLSLTAETLVFTLREWQAWLDGAKDGEFDHLA